MTNDAVITLINKIPGKKIVTLLSPDSVNQFMTIDVSADGEWGHHPGALAMFKAKLNSAIHSDFGNVMIRQFLPTMFNDKIPNKIEYGLIFNKGDYMPLQPDQLAQAHEHDNATGNYIGKEEGVSYGDIAEFFDTKEIGHD